MIARSERLLPFSKRTAIENLRQKYQLRHSTDKHRSERLLPFSNPHGLQSAWVVNLHGLASSSHALKFRASEDRDPSLLEGYAERRRDYATAEAVHNEECASNDVADIADVFFNGGPFAERQKPFTTFANAIHIQRQRNVHSMDFSMAVRLLNGRSRSLHSPTQYKSIANAMCIQWIFQWRSVC